MIHSANGAPSFPAAGSGGCSAGSRERHPQESRAARHGGVPAPRQPPLRAARAPSPPPLGPLRRGGGARGPAGGGRPSPHAGATAETKKTDRSVYRSYCCTSCRHRWDHPPLPR
eukprot:79418-Prorocentrum_minimum.AAC.1